MEWLFLIVPLGIGLLVLLPIVVGNGMSNLTDSELAALEDEKALRIENRSAEIERRNIAREFQREVRAAEKELRVAEKELRQAHKRIAPIEMSIEFLRVHGPLYRALGDLELRGAGIYKLGSRGDASSAVAHLAFSKDLVATADVEGEVVQMLVPGKSRRTLTRVALGGVIAGPAGMAIGGMSKKKKDSTLETEDTRTIVVTFTSPSQLTTVIQSELDISRKREVDAFMAQIASLTSATKVARWAPATEELEGLRTRLAAEDAIRADLHKAVVTADRKLDSLKSTGAARP